MSKQLQLNVWLPNHKREQYMTPDKVMYYRIGSQAFFELIIALKG